MATEHYSEVDDVIRLIINNITKKCTATPNVLN